MGIRNSLAVQSIEEKLGCGFWKRDVGADEMEWSLGLFRLLGRDPEIEKATYTLLRQSQHPEDRLTFEKIDDNVRAGTLFAREYRVVWPDGTIRKLAHRGDVIFDHKGEPAFDVAIVWDVEDRERELDEVLADERRIRVILEALDLFIKILRTEGFDAGAMGAYLKDPAETNHSC